MRIGIVAFRQQPYISANTAIAYIIGEQISKRNDVIYIGHKQDKKQDCVKTYQNSKVFFFNEEPVREQSRIKDYLVRCGLPWVGFYKEAHTLAQIIKRESVDAVICVIAPNEDAFITMSAMLKVPVYFYQLDPFYNLHDVDNKWQKRIFIHYLRRVNHLFTTELLMNLYKKDPMFKQLLRKISVVQFPKLINYTDNDIKIKEKTILLYSGSLYADRRPEYLIELVSCLPENCEIVFCGKCEMKDDEEKLLNNGVKCKGYCSQSELKKEMARADIFINIGNTVKNQMPSKVIDYIAYGKPIINLSQIEMCSSKNVLKNYRYYFDVNVQTIQKRRNEIRNFIIQHKGKRIPWDEVQKQYREYTPEYVVEHIMQEIEKDVCKEMKQ